MNWDAIGAIAQLIATLGLFVSIIYLAIQVRQGTILSRTAAEQAAVNSFRDFTTPITVNPALGRIWQAGLGDMNSLSREEQARFFMLAFHAMKGAESVHSSFVNNFMDEDTWSGWHHLFLDHLTSPGMRQYWALRSDLFSAQFRSYVDSLPGDHRSFTVADLKSARPMTQ